MEQLLSQLGIDWKLLLSQAVNFFLLLIVLRLFVYKPLLQMLHERRERIEEGIEKAKEADIRLLEAEEMKRSENKRGRGDGDEYLAEDGNRLEGARSTDVGRSEKERGGGACEYADVASCTRRGVASGCRTGSGVARSPRDNADGRIGAG